MDLDAYFARIGWNGSRAATLEVLAGLCLRHTASFPFENLDILRGWPILVDLPSISQKLVAQGRGGYCFEQNTLFQAVLSELGFAVRALGARVRLGAAAAAETARTHMLLRVELDGSAYLVDVGFGMTPTAPLRLEVGTEQAQHLSRYRLTHNDAHWTLHVHERTGFTPAYVFDDEPWFAIDTEVANHYTSTHPHSFFTLAPLVIRQNPERGEHYILRGREWSLRRGALVESHTLSGSEQALEVLAQHFGLELPEGTRLRGLD